MRKNAYLAQMKTCVYKAHNILFYYILAIGLGFSKIKYKINCLVKRMENLPVLMDVFNAASAHTWIE